MGCTQSYSPDPQELPPGMTPEIATDLDLFAKWCYAHYIQYDRFFILDIPHKGYEFYWSGMSEREIEEGKSNVDIVPADLLMDHITITDIREYATGKYLIFFTLDEEGQSMLIAKHPDYARSEHWVQRMASETSLTFEVENGKVFLTSASPSEWESQSGGPN